MTASTTWTLPVRRSLLEKMGDTIGDQDPQMSDWLYTLSEGKGPGPMPKPNPKCNG